MMNISRSPNTPSPESISSLNLDQDFVIRGFKQIYLDPVGYVPTFERYSPETITYAPDTLICTRLPSHDHPHGVTQCILTTALKSHIFSIPDFPRPPSPPETRYHIATTQTKGLALFAMSNIEVGQLILAERPLLVTPSDIPLHGQEIQKTAPHSNETMVSAFFGSLVHLIVYSMLEKNKLDFYDLHNSYQEEVFYHGRFKTNAMELKISGTDTRFKGVMKTMSRINHSYCPNSVYHFDLPSFSVRLYAVRPILAGEEITISYISLETPASERALPPKKLYAIPPCPGPCCTGPTTAQDLLRTSMSIKANDLYNQMMETRVRIERTVESLRRTSLNVSDTPDEEENIKRTYESAMTLLRDIKKYGLDASTVYASVVSTTAWCCTALSFWKYKSPGRTITDNKVKKFRMSAAMVLRAHYGLDGEEYKKLVSENRIFGT